MPKFEQNEQLVLELFKVGSVVDGDPYGWVVPVDNGVGIGIVCGQVNLLTNKVPVSPNDAPDTTVYYYYNPRRYCFDDYEFRMAWKLLGDL